MDLRGLLNAFEFILTYWSLSGRDCSCNNPVKMVTKLNNCCNSRFQKEDEAKILNYLYYRSSNFHALHAHRVVFGE